MKTLCTNNVDLNQMVNLLFNHGTIELTGDKKDINKTKDELLEHLCNKGIMNIHHIVNRNIVQLT